MKIHQKFITLFIALLIAANPLCALAEDIGVYIDGSRMTFDLEPYMKNDRVMVPMRGIFEHLGAEVIWDDATRSITVKSDSVTAYLTIDESAFYINGAPSYTDAPPELCGNRTFVPLRTVSEMFGCEVNWNGEKNRVDISTNKTAYYPGGDKIPDFGACFNLSPTAVIDSSIYTYDISSLSVSPEEKYAEIMAAAGFLKVASDSYTVFSRSDVTVLAGRANGMFRVVISKE